MPETIKDIAKTEVPVISNPSHIPLDAEAIQVDWKELAHFTYPISSLISAGVPVGFGSDAPVATVNPFHAVACATSRRGSSSKVVNGREAIGYATAMEIITERSAKIIGGPKRGRLEKGWLADLAITQDFRGLDPWECVNTKFLATYIGGRLAWTP
jgi:predicted amidohydrolase YtcJ